jgi:putative redox protein
MRNVKVGWAGGKFAQDIEIAAHALRADEERDRGGDDTGASPHELLLAALGSCPATKPKVYAERKGWPVRDVRVELSGAHSDAGFTITRTLRIDGDLDAEQRQRLLEIADKCPVHKTLVGEIRIDTSEMAR